MIKTHIIPNNIQKLNNKTVCSRKNLIQFNSYTHLNYTFLAPKERSLSSLGLWLLFGWIRHSEFSWSLKTNWSLDTSSFQYISKNKTFFFFSFNSNFTFFSFSFYHLEPWKNIQSLTNISCSVLITECTCSFRTSFWAN